MKEREYLVKAQEADAIADASESPVARHVWESIAKEYRKLAQAVTALRRADPTDPLLR